MLGGPSVCAIINVSMGGVLCVVRRSCKESFQIEKLK